MGSSISFIGAIADIQLIRPADQENFGLNFTVVSPPEQNLGLLWAMDFLSSHDGFMRIEINVTPAEDNEPA